ncbi:hypothetical protein F1559_000431 [Cyanidiococcus yangmingshanensis]|uniref:N-acetyltransferase domain-containing protein n=1 Tax=Cyanidiococcus yangmingshanensis TaxID=2690220 RepID=A0A7J7IBN1_9RHOD|nr:hypothetical protein F1559_000431 [Cyanidiococcus yangmingshanensis]
MENPACIPFERQHKEQAKSLLSGVLPVPLVRLSQRLEEAIDRDARLGLAHVAVYRQADQSERVVGIILAHLETTTTSLETCCAMIYVDALAVDGVFQGQRLGTRLLERVLVPSLSNGLRVREVYLHTPCHDNELIMFYRKRGFVPDGDVVENYYPRRWVRPPHAIVMRWRPSETTTATPRAL